MYANNTYTIYPIPPSTSQTIIFPLNTSTYKFETNHYNPMMSSGKVTTEEAAQFLERVQQPILEWRDKQFFLKYPWAIIFLVILLPLLYLYLIYQCCTSCSKQKEWEGVLEKSRAIVREHSATFSARGLTWITPVAFPRWIELWIGQPQQNMMGNMQPGVMMGQNGYSMVPMNQQNNLMPNQQQNTNDPYMQYGNNQYGNNQFNNQQMQYGNNMYTQK